MSFIIATPDVGDTDGFVEVFWHIGSDIKYDVQENDEVRMLSPDGSVCVRVPVWACGSPCRMTLVAPSKPGSFILCIYDNTAKKRVLGVTYRIAGNTMPFRQTLELRVEEVACGDRLDVEIPPEYTNGYAIVCDAGLGENLGFLTTTVNPFEHAVGQQAYLGNKFGLVAPEKPGKYQIRYMKKAPCGLLMTQAVSWPFVVHPLPPHLTRSPYEVEAKLNVSTRTCIVGHSIKVEWDVRIGGHLLSPLDCIVFHCYGRSEEARQPRTLYNCVGAKLYAGTCEVRAPSTPGVYDVAYFCFASRRCIFYGTNVVVEDCTASLHCAVERCDAGKGFEVAWTLDQFLVRSTDRVLVCDDLGNVHDSFPVSKTRTVDKKLIAGGGCSIHLTCPGKYSLWYFSTVLNRVAARMSSYMTIEGTDKPVIHCDIRVVHEVCHNQAVQVMYELVGEDSRSENLQVLDCLALFRHGAHDCDVGGQVDNVSHAPWLDVHYIQGKPAGTLFFTALSDPGLYEIRFLVCVRHHYHRISVSVAQFNVTPSQEEPTQEFAGIGITSLPLTATSACQHRFAPNIDNHSKTTESDERESDGRVSRHSSSQHSMSRHASVTSQRHLSVSSQRHTGLHSRQASIALSRSMSRHASMASNYRSSKAYFTPVTALLHFNNATEYAGAVLAPKTHSSTDQVVVTYHILEGLPRDGDKIVLMNAECTKIISESMVSAGIGRPDLTLGSVWLAPPKMPGQYMCGYFSEKHSSIVLVSKPFRVNTLEENCTETLADGEGTPGGRLALAQAAAGAHQPTRRSQTRVLLIGAVYAQQVVDLKGPLNDVNRLYNAFVEQGEVQEKDIRLLHDFQRDPTLTPTAINIRNAIRWLVQDAQPKDRLFFHFSGYGTRMTNLEGAAAAFDNALVPIDYDWGPRMITFFELRGTLFDNVPHGAFLMATLDCCFVSNVLDVCCQYDIYCEGVEHRGVQKLKAQREKDFQDPHAPTRCLAPPKGMFPHVSPTTDQPFFGSLAEIFFRPYSTMPMPRHTDGKNKGVFILEACRDPHELSAQSAWDVFLPEASSTVGLLSWALAVVMEEAAWDMTPVWLLHERIMQQIRRTPYGESQTPRLWVSDLSTLDLPILSTKN